VTIRPDYDGGAPESPFFHLIFIRGKDTVMVNWAASVVENFKQPSVVDKPDGLERKYFEDHVEHVKSFLVRHQHSKFAEGQGSFLTALLRSLGDEYVGRYSRFHSIATYSKGYSDPETIRLAYM
jgi:RNA-dependent RNA polymerase